ncbi:DUF4882 family protein [Acinetobacter wuhouensis]|uniref:DUF4882 domain-containing protein n=1 Tax=Acinetobacter wuhouensis TaxID=1879050 RepID=A0A4Q7AHQ8_9GAMM|nr:DUF4882 family protein [Acinetobacter wuhouensis]RZG47521.1 DUF4882 domain-containing protein [Acinetobacter wuhouensis]
MKKILVGVFFIGMVSNIFASCDYNFDATTSDYSQIPFVQPFPSVNGQSGSATVQFPISKMYMQMSHKLAQTQITKQFNANSGVSVPSNGTFVVESKINNIAPLATSGILNQGNTIYGYSGSSSFMLGYTIINMMGNQPVLSVSSNPTALGGLESNHLQIPLNLPLSANYRIGFYFNQNSGQVGIIVNGVNYGYLNGFSFQPITSINIAHMVNMHFTSNSNDPVIGTTLDETINTDASQITQNYPTGAKDICGNLI